MANTLGIDFSADVDEFAADIPSVLVWAGQTITGSRGAWSRDLDALAEGILNMESCEWIGSIADFTSSTLPRVNVDITVDGSKAHITTKREHEGVVVLELRRKVAAGTA